MILQAIKVVITSIPHLRNNSALCTSDGTVCKTLPHIDANLTPFDAFANRPDPELAALVRAAGAGSTLFANGNMIYVDLTSNFFFLCSTMNVYL